MPIYVLLCYHMSSYCLNVCCLESQGGAIDFILSDCLYGSLCVCVMLFFWLTLMYSSSIIVSYVILLYNSFIILTCYCLQSPGGAHLIHHVICYSLTYADACIVVVLYVIILFTRMLPSVPFYSY